MMNLRTNQNNIKSIYKHVILKNIIKLNISICILWKFYSSKDLFSMKDCFLMMMKFVLRKNKISSESDRRL